MTEEEDGLMKNLTSSLNPQGKKSHLLGLKRFFESDTRFLHPRENTGENTTPVKACPHHFDMLVFETRLSKAEKLYLPLFVVLVCSVPHR